MPHLLAPDCRRCRRRIPQCNLCGGDLVFPTGRSPVLHSTQPVTDRYYPYVNMLNEYKKAVLSQGELRDADVNFDTYIEF